MSAQTVCGNVAVSQLGFTLPHEHLLCTCSPALKYPLPESHHDIQQEIDKVNFGEPNLDTWKGLNWVRYFPYSSHDNLIVHDTSVATDETIAYRDSVKAASELFFDASLCGSTIVDVTVNGIGSTRDKKVDYMSLYDVSKKTGVNVVCSTGFYTAHIHDLYKVEERSVEQLAEEMIDDLTKGTEEGIKCGVIGEIGTQYPIQDSERKVLRAAALAQRKTGAPLIIHPGRSSKAPWELADILREAGADLNHTVMSHLDRTMPDAKELRRFIDETGMYVEFDLFGTECSYYQLWKERPMPSDAERIAILKDIVDNGEKYTHKLLLSHDLHTKHRWLKYGGHGLVHIPRNIVPRMLDGGFSQKVVHRMVVDNPAEWLRFR